MRTTVPAGGLPTTIALCEPLSAEVPVAEAMTLKIRVACSGGDPGGGFIELRAGGEPSAQPLLAAGEGTAETEAVSVLAPEQVGDHVWTATFPRQTVNGVAFAASTLTLAFRTKPQSTSLAVWDIPSPAVAGERFTIKVGAKSTGEYRLHGARIEIVDEADTVIGAATLGGEKWPGTSALYWTEIELTAPATEGLSDWTARFTADDVALPHTPSSAKFGFPTTRRPEHVVTVIVLAEGTGEPIPGAAVRLGRHQAPTDETGTARLAVPSGTHDLIVWKVRYETPPRKVDVAGDLTLRIEGRVLPEEDPYDRLYG